ncbi:MAG: metal-dependent hydrolase [Bacillota bacterium]
MRGTTHAAAGVFLGGLAGSAGGGESAGIIWGMALGGIAALLPDMDHPGSMVGRLIRPVGVYLEERWGHRDSPTHTAMFVLLSSLPLAAAWIIYGLSAAPFAAALTGGASHIILDALTRSGVRPWRYLYFFPRRWREKKYGWRLETGNSPLEWVLTAGFLVATLIFVILNLR